MFDNGSMAVSKRVVLRSGFGILIALLVVCTALAWRIQESFSQRSVDIHRRLVHEQELLTSLRRVIWSIGIYVRDFYLNPSPKPGEISANLREARIEADSLLGQLRSTTTRAESIKELHKHFLDLWNAAFQATHTDMDPIRRFEYLQQEIVSRRDNAGKILREIEGANASSLAQSEKEFNASRSNATSSLLTILILCVVAGTYVAQTSIRHSERLEAEAQQRFAEVSDAKRQLEHLSARLMDVQEEERTRLSRELHDEIVQNLAVLKMEITQAQAAAARGVMNGEGLTRARELAETTVRTVRDISLLLRPSLLDDLGLIPALQWQAEEFTARTHVPCVLVEDVSTEDMPEAAKTCVYRVVQEALRNCEKHSGATEVCITVLEREARLEVSIRDNGRGFQDGAARQFANLGVLGMKERAAALGGSLQTGNAPKGGAEVRLTLPMNLPPEPLRAERTINADSNLVS
jgi:signal transduction histidine kinase